MHSPLLVRSTFLALSALALALPANLIAADEPVLLRYRVDTRYDDSSQSLDALRRLADFAPPAVVAVPIGSNLDQLIVKYYGLGKSQVPLTYALIRDQIVQLNHLIDADHIAAGTLFVPRIPRKRRPISKPGNLYYELPAFSKIDTAAVGFRRVSAPLIREDFKRLATPIQNVDIETTIDKLTTTSSGQALATEPNSNILDEPLAITFAASPGTNTPSDTSLLGGATKTVASLLATPVQRPVSVLLLDSGWPSPDSYNSSQALLRSMLDKARKLFQLPDSSVPRATTGRFTPLTGNTHCQDVLTALAELQAIDDAQNPKVPIAFLPLTLDQNSKDIITEVLRIYFIMVEKENQRDGIMLQPVVDRAKTYAAAVIASLPPRADGLELKTSRVLLSAYYYIADAAAEVDGGVYFLCEPWTVKADLLQSPLPGVPFGLTVVSAGKRGDFTAVPGGFDFARRCYPANNVLTVEGITTDGTACQTAAIASTRVDDSFVVAFEGKGPGGCATSYSAPRVAWLLAVAEAYRKQSVDRADWAHDLFGRLRAARDTSQPTTSLRRVLLDVGAFLAKSSLPTP